MKVFSCTPDEWCSRLKFIEFEVDAFGGGEPTHVTESARNLEDGMQVAKNESGNGCERKYTIHCLGVTAASESDDFDWTKLERKKTKGCGRVLSIDSQPFKAGPKFLVTCRCAPVCLRFFLLQIFPHGTWTIFLIYSFPDLGRRMSYQGS